MKTLQLSPDDIQRFALGYNNPRFLNTTLKKTHKLYSPACLFDPNIHVVVYDSKERWAQEEHSRLKMRQIGIIPYDDTNQNASYTHTIS